MSVKTLALVSALALALALALPLAATYAQSSPSSSTPSTQDSGPAVVEVDKETLLEIILGRIHRVYGGVQVLKDTMSKNGATTFRDIYMVEGALVNANDFNAESCHHFDWETCLPSEESHSIGPQMFMYELTLTRDGHFSGKAAIAGAKHLNNSKVLNHRIINDYRIMQFEWDTDSDKINTYRATIASMDIRLGLFKKNGSWVSLNLGAGTGVAIAKTPNDIGSATTPRGNSYTGSTAAWSLDGRAGLEFHIAINEAFSLHGMTMYQVRSMLFGSSETEGSDSTSSYRVKTSLTNQLELNYHFNTGHRGYNSDQGYKSSVGIYLQSQHMQKDIMHRGPEVIDVGSHDRDFSGNTYTGGFQIKW